MAASMASCFGRKVVQKWTKSRFLFAKPFSNIRGISTSKNQHEKWHLCSAVCLERSPVLTPPMTDIETQYFNHLQTLEREYSVLSDHELRHKKDLERAEKKKKGEDDDVEQNIQTALDVEDVWEQELQEFKPVSRITEADKTDNRKSTERKLDQKLMLLVKQKLGEQTHWVFPQRQRGDESSLREVAEKSLSLCGDDLKAAFLGNSPCGFLKYKYGKDIDGHIGAKVFFFKAYHDSGDVKPAKSESIQDHLWVTKAELKDYVSEGYIKEIDKFVLEL
ncbi:large ribosomal subunit protein mL46-like [Lineus longissimus]|uniref:large ribosomal subunit protein mL46-like n=1 Tax=Lineus longissimus TaxID=88925 RepID=UPI002B4C7CCC